MKRRAANVEEHPSGSGKYRVRARIGGKLVTVSRGLDKATANATADVYGTMRADDDLRHGITVDQFGAGFLDRREARGGRSLRQDRSRWKTIEADPVGRIALASLRRGDVVEFRDRLITRKLKQQTVKNAINLLRVALADALDRELVRENVARDVKFPRSLKTTSEEDLSGVLAPAEQVALLDAVPAEHQALVAVALLTGLRWSELSWLRREDVKGSALLVRRSRNGGPTKSGKPRRVPLLPPAEAAIRQQMRAVQGPWIFPSVEGKPRQDRPRAWLEWVKAAKIERRVRWHDLRHTTATSLLAGWWSEDGSRWSLDEVCAMLGHSSIQVTERYARKLDQTLQDAVGRMKFPGGNGGGGTSRNDTDAIGFLNRRFRCSNHLGSANDSKQIGQFDADALGTSRELPRSLKTAVKRTSPRTREGQTARRLASAYTAAFTGDEALIRSTLRDAAKAVGQ